jgi:hypothetical protein
MKQKPTTILRVCLRYIRLSLLLGWIPSLLVFVIAVNDHFPSALLDPVLSIPPFCLIAYLVFRKRTLRDRFDMRVTLGAWLAGTVATLVLIFTYFYVGLFTGDFLGYEHDYIPKMVALWVISNLFAFFWGLWFIGINYLSRYRYSWEKRKVEETEEFYD